MSTKTMSGFSADLLKGSLGTIILNVLNDEGPMHGYLLRQRVEQLFAGKIKLTHGSLYPLLHKLKKEKALLTSMEILNNRTRIYYALTPKGHSLVDERVKELREFMESVRFMLDSKPG